MTAAGTWAAAFGRSGSRLELVSASIASGHLSRSFSVGAVLGSIGTTPPFGDATRINAPASENAAKRTAYSSTQNPVGWSGASILQLVVTIRTFMNDPPPISQRPSAKSTVLVLIVSFFQGIEGIGGFLRAHRSWAGRLSCESTVFFGVDRFFHSLHNAALKSLELPAEMFPFGFLDSLA